MPQIFQLADVDAGVQEVVRLNAAVEKLGSLQDFCCCTLGHYMLVRARVCLMAIGGMCFASGRPHFPNCLRHDLQPTWNLDKSPKCFFMSVPAREAGHLTHHKTKRTAKRPFVGCYQYSTGKVPNCSDPACHCRKGMAQHVQTPRLIEITTRCFHSVNSMLNLKPCKRDLLKGAQGPIIKHRNRAMEPEPSTMKATHCKACED